MTKTYANKLTVTHKGDGQVFNALAPDVCKTPSPGGPVPIPYPNVAMSSDLADGSKNVKIEMNPVALESSNLKVSTGNEGGSAGGGIISSKIKGKLKWLAWSADVKIEGKGVVRFLDSNMHNGNANNVPGITKGKMSYPKPKKEIMCGHCGKPANSDGHEKMESSTDSRNAANVLLQKNRTVAALIVQCPGEGASQFTGVAGRDSRGGLTVDNFESVAKNFKTGVPVSPSAPTDQFTPGNCSEQKALFDAGRAGAFPLKPGCEANLSVGRNDDNKHIESCPTCQRVLSEMLCANEPKET